MFAMLQEQHDKQIAAMTATNKANMDAMMERMNAILAGGGEKQMAQHDKDNPPPGRNRHPLAGTGTGTGTDQTKQPQNQMPSVPTAKSLSSTNQITVPSLRQTRTNVGRAGSPFMPLPDKHWGCPQ